MLEKGRVERTWLMRLKEEEISAIKQVIHQFDPDAPIYLFGSRVDDARRGGDIDLLVLSEKISLEDKIKLKVMLYEQLGEQKIDIVLPSKSNEAFVNLAKKEGILL